MNDHCKQDPARRVQIIAAIKKKHEAELNWAAGLAGTTYHIDRGYLISIVESLIATTEEQARKIEDLQVQLLATYNLSDDLRFYKKKEIEQAIEIQRARAAAELYRYKYCDAVQFYTDGYKFDWELK